MKCKTSLTAYVPKYHKFTSEGTALILRNFYLSSKYYHIAKNVAYYFKNHLLFEEPTAKDSFELYYYNVLNYPETLKLIPQVTCNFFVTCFSCLFSNIQQLYYYHYKPSR